MNCLDCPKGSFSPEKAENCSVCPEGMDCRDYPAKECSIGSSSAEGYIECRVCPDGKLFSLLQYNFALADPRVTEISLRRI